MEENGIKMLPYSHSGQTVSSMQHGVVERLFFFFILILWMIPCLWRDLMHGKKIYQRLPFQVQYGK